MTSNSANPGRAAGGLTRVVIVVYPGVTLLDAAGVEVPERAQYLRVMTSELMRIASHLMAMGFLINDLGAWVTPLMHMFREREKVLDLFEMICGARITFQAVFIDPQQSPLPIVHTPGLEWIVGGY